MDNNFRKTIVLFPKVPFRNISILLVPKALLRNITIPLVPKALLRNISILLVPKALLRNAIKLSILVILTLIFTLPTYAQKDTRVGEFELKKTGINYFNYSDPDKINIEIIVLGGVKNPGKYLVPDGTTFIDLMSLTGGLINDKIGDNIKFIRPQEKSGNLKDNKVKLLKYRDLFSDDSVSFINKNNPVLKAGDIIAVPITPEKTFWDYFRDVSIVVTPLIALGSLIVTILNYTK